MMPMLQLFFPFNLFYTISSFCGGQRAVCRTTEHKTQKIEHYNAILALRVKKFTKRAAPVFIISCSLLCLFISVNQHNMTEVPTGRLQAAASGDARVELEIRRGLELLANPDERPNYIDPEYKPPAGDAGPLRQVIIRERMGIGALPAEKWFDVTLLPLLKTKRLLVDVGANVGHFAIPMAKLGHTVISFEPAQSTCNILKANVVNTTFQSNVEVHCAAASNTQETKTFHKPNGISTSFHEITQEEAKRLKDLGKEGELEQLESKTVDSVVGSTQEVFMFKTDTQGYEMSVLLGARNLLQSGRVKFLLIEFSFSLLALAGTQHVDLLNLVADQGYVCSYLAYHGPTQLVPKIMYGVVDAPLFTGNRLSVGFEEFVSSLKDVGSGKPGWTDLICWKSSSF